MGASSKQPKFVTFPPPRMFICAIVFSAIVSHGGNSCKKAGVNNLEILLSGGSFCNSKPPAFESRGQ